MIRGRKRHEQAKKQRNKEKIEERKTNEQQHRHKINMK